MIWRDGIIVAASHTVRRDDRIPVTLHDGSQLQATVAGRDENTDLIALRLDTGAISAASLPRFNDSETTRVGTLALAVGRPGKQPTASFGIVSAVVDGLRTPLGTRIDRALRLDLTIYDGFSGGALVNAGGAVLGINNSALARGTPMAIPATTVDRVLEELLAHGHVRRSYIGVAVHPVALSPGLVKRLGADHENALLVLSVAEPSPAHDAGVLVGDIILGAGGQNVRRMTDLLDMLAASRPGDPVPLRLLRGGQVVDAIVTPADRVEGSTE